MSNHGRARIAVIDRHGLFADCLVAVFEARGYVASRVPLEPTAPPERLTSDLLALRPDVALVNADLALDGHEPRLIRALTRHAVAVVVITDSADQERWGEYLAAGARIVIPQTQPLPSIVSVVRHLSRGRNVLDLSERDRLIELGSKRQAEARFARLGLSRLSEHESLVLRQLMAGLGVREVAAARTVSDATVRSQVKSILGKLGVQSQLSAVAIAYSAGWKPLLPVASGPDVPQSLTAEASHPLQVATAGRATEPARRLGA